MKGYVPNVKAKSFWDAILAPLLAPILARKYRVPQIQARYDDCCNMITQRYGRMFGFSLSDTSVKKQAPGVHVPVGCQLSEEDGKPEVIFFVPSLELTYEQMERRRPHTFRGMYERWVIICLMHELDHLSRGGVHRVSESVPLSCSIQEECAAWAETCEHTIRVFTEVCHLDVSQPDQDMYTHWVSSGRNVVSPLWRKHIRELYEPTLLLRK